MNKTSVKTSSLNDNDEIDLIELFVTLWNSKVLIIWITIATLSIGLLYNFTRARPSPVDKVSTQAHQKNDLTTSIILSKLWAISTEKVSPYFSTKGMAKYRLGNNPYSTNALFIRALEQINSLEEKSSYLKETKMGLNFNINYPAKISDTFEISTTTKNETEVKNIKISNEKIHRAVSKKIQSKLIHGSKIA